LDDAFFPIISDRVVIESYARKLFQSADIIFCRKKHELTLLGMLAYYARNRFSNFVYITYLGVRKNVRKQGISNMLLSACIHNCINLQDVNTVRTRTWCTNRSALNLYKSHGFLETGVTHDRPQNIWSIELELPLRSF